MIYNIMNEITQNEKMEYEMRILDRISNEDITLFLNAYNQGVSENPLVNTKIPMWAEYLRAKQYYIMNNIDVNRYDPFFKKRYQITKEDLITIHRLIDRVKRNKGLTKESKTNVQGLSEYAGEYATSSNFMTGDMSDGNSKILAYTNTSPTVSIYDNFSENVDYNKTPKFAMMEELQPAMLKYKQQMQKVAKRNNWKGNNNFDRPWKPTGYVNDEPDPYYTQELNQSRPQTEFDEQKFAKTKLFNMDKSDIINKLDLLNTELNNQQLITNNFDDIYKRTTPNLNVKRKDNYLNEINESLDQPMQHSLTETRRWQDADILNAVGPTRNNSSIPNKNPFEHHYDYLDGNYNRSPDPRILGASSRMENRSTFKR